MAHHRLPGRRCHRHGGQDLTHREAEQRSLQSLQTGGLPGLSDTRHAHTAHAAHGEWGFVSDLPDWKHVWRRVGPHDGLLEHDHLGQALRVGARWQSQQVELDERGREARDLAGGLCHSRS